MATASHRQFLQSLSDCGLVTRQQVEACRRQIRNMSRDLLPTTAMWADVLVRRGLLTPFQGRVALEGHLDDLVLGDYVVTDEVGHGGMGTVLKAHRRSGTDVLALKRINDGVADTLSVGPGLDDLASHTHELDHPNIVHVLDVHGREEHPYLVSEFVKGTDVKHLMRSEGRLPPLLAMDLVRAVADGLGFAHRQGLVHGNIKPANILVTAEGIAKLSDFGLLRLDRTDDFQQLERIIGMFDYIAPERTMHLAGVDPRSDQYSLGCTLYHMIAGSPPFPGGGAMSKLLAHQSKTPVPIEQVCRGVPDELARLVERLMAKDPKQRFRSPEEFLEAMRRPIQSQRFVHGAAIDRQARPPWQRIRRPRHWHWTSLVGPLGTVAAIVAIIILAWPRGSGSTRATRDASPDVKRAVRQPPPARAPVGGAASQDPAEKRKPEDDPDDLKRRRERKARTPEPSTP